MYFIFLHIQRMFDQASIEKFSSKYFFWKLTSLNFWDDFHNQSLFFYGWWDKNSPN